MRTLYKSTIIIWTDFDPDDFDIDALALEAVTGSAYCSSQTSEEIIDPENDPDWDGTEFFGVD